MHESEKGKWKWSRVWLLATPWTAAYQAPASMGLSRQKYWSGVPLPSPVQTAYHPEKAEFSSATFSKHSTRCFWASENQPEHPSWPLLAVGPALTHCPQQYTETLSIPTSVSSWNLLGFISSGAGPYELQRYSEDKEFVSKTLFNLLEYNWHSLREKDRGWVGWEWGSYNFKHYCLSLFSPNSTQKRLILNWSWPLWKHCFVCTRWQWGRDF